MKRSSALLSFVCALSLMSPASAQCSLATIFTGTSAFPGNMFDVTNLSGTTVRITSLDLHLAVGTWAVEVWALTGGGSVNATNAVNQSLWTLVGSFPGTTSLGISVATPLPTLCSALDIPAGSVQALGVFVASGSGNGIRYTGTATAVGTPYASDGTLQISEGFGMPYFAATPLSPRRMDVRLNYICPGPPGPPPGTDYQTNQNQSRLTINNLVGNACGPAIANQTAYSCTPVVPATGTIAVTSTQIGLPWDFVMSPLPLVPASAGGLPLPDGQIVNLNLGGPLSFLNGFLGAVWPGVGLPGVNSTTLAVGYSLAATTDMSVQTVFIDPSTASGIRLSQGTELHVALSAPLATFSPAPLADNATVAFNFTAAPYCWPSIPFFGVMQTTMHLLSNGRVMFGAAGTTTAAPTQALFASNNGSAGLWTDWNPALPGGSAVATNVGGGIIRVDFAGAFAGETLGPVASFGIQFDINTGEIRLDGLTGVPANPQGTAGGLFSATADSMIMGLSRGGGVATNGGATLFTNVGSGLAPNPTQMWFDWYAGVAAGAGRCPSLTAGTLNGISFIPSVLQAPNYDWSGF